MQRRFAVNVWSSFGLLTMAQVLHLSLPFVTCLAHDWSVGVSVLKGYGIDAVGNVAQVGSDNGHVVLCGFPLRYQVRVPVMDESHVRIHLHGKVLAAVHPMGNVAGKDGSDGQNRRYLKDVHQVGVLAHRLFRVFGTGPEWLAAPRNQFVVLSLDPLIDDGDSQPLGVFRSQENVFDGRLALGVSIRGHRHINRLQSGFRVKTTNLRGLFGCDQGSAVVSQEFAHSARTVGGWPPEFGNRHLSVLGELIGVLLENFLDFFGIGKKDTGMVNDFQIVRRVNRKSVLQGFNVVTVVTVVIVFGPSGCRVDFFLVRLCLRLHRARCFRDTFGQPFHFHGIAGIRLFQDFVPIVL
mmetsp:Transcript_22451/g.62524  ORF Transcript_22451/g.62524 Transcript_22451/m.62524 type:complete len:351 (+) Transcript_22451:1198-2250(+)